MSKIDEMAMRAAATAREQYRVVNFHMTTQEESDRVFLEAYEQAKAAQQPAAPETLTNQEWHQRAAVFHDALNIMENKMRSGCRLDDALGAMLEQFELRRRKL